MMIMTTRRKIMSLVKKIRALQEAIKAEFPEGGVSISVVGLEGDQPHENKPTEYVEKMDTEKPPVIPVNEDTTTLDDVKKLLNGYAAKHGVEVAFGLVEKLTGGSKNPADIPKEKYSYVVQACMVEGAKA
jgi:hypothetical protein